MTKIFTVHDSKASAYLPPFYERASGSAIRAFEEAVNDPKHQFSRHPGDYTLFEIGEYDEETGQLTPHKTHINLGKAIDFKRQQAASAGQMPMFAVEGGNR